MFFAAFVFASIASAQAGSIAQVTDFSKKWNATEPVSSIIFL